MRRINRAGARLGPLAIAAASIVGCADSGFDKDTDTPTGVQSALVAAAGNPLGAAEAVAQLRAKFGAVDAPSKEPAAPKPVLQTTISGDRIVGTHLFAPTALAVVGGDGDADRALRDYLVANARQYRLDAVTSRGQLSHLVLVEDRVSKDVKGTEIRLLKYKQTHDGVRIADGDLNAVFWGGSLKSVAGRLIGSSDELPSVRPALSEAAARAIALRAAAGSAGEPLQAQYDGLELWAEAKQLVHRYTVHPAPGRGGETPVVGRTRLVLVDGHGGRVIKNESDSNHASAVAGTFKVYVPTNADPRGAVETIVSGNVSYESSLNRYWPWQDELTNFSPVPGYTQSVMNGSDYFFGVSSGTAFTVSDWFGVWFRQQHNNFWVQKAINTANINFTWWPPPSAYRYSPVTVLSDCNDFGGPMTGNNGCWYKDLWRGQDGDVGLSPKVSCMCIPHTGGGYLIGTASAATLDALFHESGHAVSSKYLGGGSRQNFISGACDPGAEEGASLEENIAGTYAQTMYLQEFSGNAFTQYATTQLPWMTGTGGVTSHTSNSDLSCYRAPGTDCGGNKYPYGWSLQQAYLEAARGMNCGSSPCYAMSDGAGTDQARWAWFYAVQVTASTSGYLDFVANFLAYYYNSVGYTPWSNRWWVFNHHSLVGPEYGYSPCHTD